MTLCDIIIIVEDGELFLIVLEDRAENMILTACHSFLRHSRASAVRPFIPRPDTRYISWIDRPNNRPIGGVTCGETPAGYIMWHAYVMFLIFLQKPGPGRLRWEHWSYPSSFGMVEVRVIQCRSLDFWSARGQPLASSSNRTIPPKLFLLNILLVTRKISKFLSNLLMLTYLSNFFTFTLLNNFFEITYTYVYFT